MSGLPWFIASALLAATAILRQLQVQRAGRQAGDGHRLYVICYCHLCNNGIPCSSRSILTVGSGDDERRGT